MFMCLAIFFEKKQMSACFHLNFIKMHDYKLCAHEESGDFSSPTITNLFKEMFLSILNGFLKKMFSDPPNEDTPVVCIFLIIKNMNCNIYWFLFGFLNLLII